MEKVTRIAIVEDNTSLRNEFVQLFTSTPGYACTASFRDAESALADIPKDPPDVVLMDIQLPKMSGVDCVARLRDILPDISIVMLTAYGDSNLIFQALENGASGYLLKRTAPIKLLQAIEDVLDGGVPMSGHIARLVVQTFRRRGPSPRETENLSAREEEVLKLVALGYINKEIAEHLHLALETIRGHLKNIYHKLQVRSRTEAAMKYFR